jgi:hypothetical protein
VRIELGSAAAFIADFRAHAKARESVR